MNFLPHRHQSTPFHPAKSTPPQKNLRRDALLKAETPGGKLFLLKCVEMLSYASGDFIAMAVNLPCPMSLIAWSRNSSETLPISLLS